MVTTTAPDPRRDMHHGDKLRDASIAEAAKHTEAVRAGGYTSGLGDEVLVTDPAEFTHQDLAMFYGLAARLIYRQPTTGVKLSQAEDKFVSRMLDHAGIEL